MENYLLHRAYKYIDRKKNKAGKWVYTYARPTKKKAEGGVGAALNSVKKPDTTTPSVGGHIINQWKNASDSKPGVGGAINGHNLGLNLAKPKSAHSRKDYLGNYEPNYKSDTQKKNYLGNYEPNYKTEKKRPKGRPVTIAAGKAEVKKNSKITVASSLFMKASSKGKQWMTSMSNKLEEILS